MPRIFKSVDISKEEKEVRKDYFDRHTPHIVCSEVAKRGEKFKVKVKLGNRYPHPDQTDHYIQYVQLWNRETLLVESRFSPGTLGKNPGHIEVDYHIIPEMSMNLSAMALCTNHGLWQSENQEVKVID